MICGNPDKVVQRGDRLVYCGGALAELYEALGGTVIMAGKPHAPIYREALAQAAELKEGPIDPSRVLAIGDGVATDISGANAQGLDVLFVVGGIHGGETRNASGGLDSVAAQRAAGRQGRARHLRHGRAALSAATSSRATRTDRMDGAYLEDLEIGQTAELRRTVTAPDIDAFAAVTGDTNPVHLDEAYAAATRSRAASPTAC